MLVQVRSITVLALAAAALLGGCGANAVTAAPSSSGGGGATTLNEDAVKALTDFEAVQEEMRQLRSLLEEQQYELENLKKRQRAFYDDLDQRLRARERGDTETMAGTGQPDAIQGGGATQPIDATLPPLPPAAGAGAPSAAEEKVTVSRWSERKRGNVAQEQAAYDAAFDALKRGRYGEAVEGFQGLLRDYPGSQLADDAQYWIAEAHYVTREFESALIGYRAVVDGYAGSQRVPEALLKIGYLQYELGAYDNARATLSQIIERFPGTAVAMSAYTRLKKMDREGR